MSIHYATIKFSLIRTKHDTLKFTFIFMVLEGNRTFYRGLAVKSQGKTIKSSAVCHDSKTKSTRQSFFNFQENLNEGK
jgi:hypothetical protein